MLAVRWQAQSRFRTFAVVISAMIFAIGSFPPGAQAQHAPSVTAEKILALPSLKPWKGDLDGLLKRRAVRILVVPSRTLFFQDKGEILGTTAEAGQALETWLNKRYGKKPYKIQVAFVPTSRDRLLKDLEDGKGDIAAANLTITSERSAIVDFAKPWAGGVKEVLVTGPSAPSVAAIGDLSGQEIKVRKSSSYHDHLVSLNERLAKERGRPVKISAADENLEDEDLMEMVGAGLLPWAVVDIHKAKLWNKIIKGLTVREDIVINDGGEIAWAIRKNSPQLKKELDEFVADYTTNPDGKDARYRYYGSGKTVKNALAAKEVEKFKELVGYFRTYGAKYNVDPYLLAAQGYQESGFDQKMRMKSGAVGIMQMKPSSARDEIGINGIVTRAEDNIHAGAAYIRFVSDKYIDGADIDDLNRTLLALASYNAGPGSLKKCREWAAKHGFNPNLWFGNVENGAAAVAGQETVQYIGNIYKYYLVYSTLLPDR
jgi:membrane-bound lytic murein transglycosylase MltF